MRTDYEPRPSVFLEPKTTYQQPSRLLGLVDLESPAVEVLTDFNIVEPKTVSPHVRIDDALEQMKEQGVRMLFVTNEADEIIGLVTAKDIQGERPIKFIQEKTMQRGDLKVETIMTTQAKITALNMESVELAKVGHIVQTLKETERQHTLVVELDKKTGRQIVRGMFSTSQINKQMRTRASDDIAPAHTFAEIVENVG